MITPSPMRRVYDYFLRKWFLSAILLTLTGHWFIIVRILGPQIGALDSAGKMVKWAATVTWIAVGLSLAFALLKTRADRYNDELKANGQYVLDRMLQCVDAIKKRKLRRFCAYIHRNHGANHHALEPFHEITQPLAQIESILENIQIALSEVFGINRNDIGFSILYKTDVDDKWRYLHTVNIDNDLGLNALILNPATTARQVVDGKTSSLFFPDKREGIRLNQFVPGPRDTAHGNVGSVLSRDISLSSDLRFVHAVLNITTYGKQLCEQNNFEARKKIEELLLPSFEYRIQLELALLYIREVLAVAPPLVAEAKL